MQVFCFSSALAQSDVVVEGDTCRHIDQYLNSLVKEKSFSGGLLIVKNGKKIFSKGYGFANKTGNIPFTPSTLCSMGSITKNFTAAAILKLEESGKISLNDNLRKFFPDVPQDKAYITLHQLLTHSSGFSEILDSDKGDYQVIKAREYLEAAFRQALRFQPGTKAIYTNVGMSILGIIIEQVSGMDYEAFLKKEFFQPIGIRHIGYQFPQEKGISIAHGYRKGQDWGTHQGHFNSAGGGPYWNLKANGGLEASLNEMYLWANAFTYPSVLSKVSVERMFTPQIIEDNTDGFYSFGYGCNVSKSRRNTRVIDNGGSNGIYFARLLRYPEEGLVFYMVTNEQSAPTEKVLPNVTQLFFNGKIDQDAFEAKRGFENPMAEKVYRLLLEKGPDRFAENLEALGLKVEDDLILLEAGQKLMDENKAPEGIALFEYYTHAFPNIVVAKNNLGDLYRLSGQKQKAIESYRAALHVRPGNPRATEELKKLGEMP